MIRVVIADDHSLVRRGLRQLLESQPDFAIVGEVASGTEVSSAVVELAPDVLLIDINMPGPGFLSVMRELRAVAPRVAILVVSAHAEALYARRAFLEGASGYLYKGNADEELIVAIRTAARGGRYVSDSLAEELAANLSVGARGAALHDSLTGREHEVMLALAAGHNVTAIAGQLGLSVKTISTHRTRLMGKLGLHTNAELASYAREHGLIPRE